MRSISQVRLQLAEALARRLFGILITLPLVFNLQVRPFLRVHRLDVGSLEFAVRSRLRYEKGRVRPATGQFGMAAFFGMHTGTRGNANGRDPGHTLWRVPDLKVALTRIAGAACDPHRTDDDKDGPKPWRQRRQAIETQLRLRRFAAIICPMRRPRNRHAARSVSKRGKLRRLFATKSRVRSAAILN
jgi:hypothetical protein